MPADRLVLFITVGISFGFVFLGLWLAPHCLWTGMALTALAILGWLLMPAYLGYWIAFLGGRRVDRPGHLHPARLEVEHG